VTGSMLSPALAALAGSGVIAALCAVASIDAARFRISLGWSGLALLCALAWWAVSETGSGWMTIVGLGALAGVLGALAQIGIATVRGRPWPLLGGDIVLMAVIGAVLGILWLPWGLAAGCLGTLAYRAWLQRRRGRPFRRGYVPLAPGMVGGTIAVFAGRMAGVLPDRWV